VSLLVGLPTTLLRPNNEAMMKRYNFEMLAGLPQVTIMHERENGEWVRYEDVADAIKAEREACAKLCEYMAEVIGKEIAREIRARGKK